MEDSAPEKLRSPETLDPKSIAIVTATFYPSWYPGEIRGELTADKLRGDLALELFHQAKEQGFQVALVDGGSSEEFRKALTANGIEFQPQKENGSQGAARRQALEIAGGLEGIKVICETEPEKVSMVSDCLETAAILIVNGQADIVIPKRGQESSSTLPFHQAKSEQRSNKMYKQILRAHGLLKEEDPDIDFWFGVRLFANKPEVVELFKRKYQFDPTETKLHQVVEKNIDVYSNPLFFPIIEALKRGFKVRSVEVQYTHPRQQTEFENDKPEFNRKRDSQRRTIITELLHFIRMLRGSPKSRISQEKGNESS